MDFNELRHKLKLKEEKFPNITNVWKQYIDLKEKNHNKFVNNFNNMMDNIDNISNDMTKENIIFLFLLFSS
tara:strand:+ start:1667 stop:1879 length:213 start_codon:yes stop_codon:yes gene_type:complete